MACYVDVRRGGKALPDCVFDHKKEEDCTYAEDLVENGKGKKDCEYWSDNKIQYCETCGQRLSVRKRGR